MQICLLQRFNINTIKIIKYLYYCIILLFLNIIYILLILSDIYIHIQCSKHFTIYVCLRNYI